MSVSRNIWRSCGEQGRNQIIASETSCTKVHCGTHCTQDGWCWSPNATGRVDSMSGSRKWQQYYFGGTSNPITFLDFLKVPWQDHKGILMSQSCCILVIESWELFALCRIKMLWLESSKQFKSTSPLLNHRYVWRTLTLFSSPSHICRNLGYQVFEI